VTEPDSNSENRPSTGGTTYITFGIVGFVVTAIAVFAFGSSLRPDTAVGYALSARVHPRTDGSFQLTIDTTDKNNWVGVDLGDGRRVKDADSADLLLRRYKIRAPSGAVDMGKRALGDANASGLSEADWQLDHIKDDVWSNPAFERWYSYSYWTHLLETIGHIYAVRLRDGRGIAYVQMVSYYCKPEGSGCLTIVYRLDQPG
jgi:hypothetical protein